MRTSFQRTGLGSTDSSQDLVLHRFPASAQKHQFWGYYRSILNIGTGPRHRLDQLLWLPKGRGMTLIMCFMMPDADILSRDRFGVCRQQQDLGLHHFPDHAQKRQFWAYCPSILQVGK